MDTFKVKNLEGKKKGDKPSIFIGSSYESLVIAEAVKNMFGKDTCEVDIWDEDIFDPSIQKKASKYAVNERLKNKIIQHRKHYLDNATDAPTQQDDTENDLLPLNIHSLKNFTDIYDFAIFIFVPEDKLVSQSRTSAEGKLAGTGTRHNVVFELGLFLGRIGSKKTFIIADNTIKDFIEHFFTDLKGVKTYNYEGNYTSWLESESEKDLPYDNASLLQQVANIQDEITKTKAEIEIGFLPSTSLAIGLFENMIKLVIENLGRMKRGEDLKTQKDDKPFVKPIDLEFPLERTEMILKLVVPDQLSEASHQSYQKYVDYYGMVKTAIPTPTRPITVFCHPDVLQPNGRLVIYDIPSTLFSSWNAIELLTPVTDIKELLNSKERENFKKAIPILIEKALKDGKIKGAEHIKVVVISLEDIAEDFPNMDPLLEEMPSSQVKDE